MYLIISNIITTTKENNKYYSLKNNRSYCHLLHDFRFLWLIQRGILAGHPLAEDSPILLCRFFPYNPLNRAA